jgi:hypothetical protein
MDQHPNVKAANVAALTAAKRHTLDPNQPPVARHAHKLVTYTIG